MGEVGEQGEEALLLSGATGGFHWGFTPVEELERDTGVLPVGLSVGNPPANSPPRAGPMAGCPPEPPWGAPPLGGDTSPTLPLGLSTSGPLRSEIWVTFLSLAPLWMSDSRALLPSPPPPPPAGWSLGGSDRNCGGAALGGGGGGGAGGGGGGGGGISGLRSLLLTVKNSTDQSRGWAQHTSRIARAPDPVFLTSGY